MSKEKFLYALHLADTTLILAQRHAEWTGHGPVLEQDIAITNISLDLLGQARHFYQYATGLYNAFSEEEKAALDTTLPSIWKGFGRELNEDDLAFLRDEHQFLNLLLVELPRGDWAYTVLKQFFFSVWQRRLYEVLVLNDDKDLAAIAEKSLKETIYHLRWSSEWVIRLGDGTDESRRRIEAALAELWPFTGEMFQGAEYEAIDPSQFKEGWLEQVQSIFSQATLSLPKQSWMQEGGKSGRHTEYMGYLLAEMQHLQRAYPDSVW